MRFLAAAALVALLGACGPQDPAKNGASSVAAPSAAETNAEMQARIAELPAPYNQASYEAGRRVFAQCRSCHTIGAGEGNRVGPNLHGVFGREIGTAQGFTYSDAVANANFVWDAAQLDHWLSNPSTFLPGNRMAFAGVRDETQRRDVIAFLMVETDPDEGTPPAP
ncbi:MAG: cytochrome c family protein [Hyphomonadaceae bacterium]